MTCQMAELIQQCHEYIDDNYPSEFGSVKLNWVQFNYGLDSFTLCSGTNCVYVEYECNSCSAGWFTCNTFQEFKKIFDAFASSSFFIDAGVHMFNSLSCGDTPIHDE
jgi:hypothetical protein